MLALAGLAVSAAQAPDAGAASASAPQERPNSVLLFAGRMSTTDLATTLLLDARYTPVQDKISYDNDIVGVEYERDLLGAARDVRLRAEVGVAERYGHYLVCCLAVLPGDPRFYPDLTQRLAGRIYSTELWAGGKLRWENLRVGSQARFELAFTLGLSGVTRSIGRERQREIDDNGNAHLLYYLAPEVGLGLVALPDLELVFRVPHRSGGAKSLGHMEEGYNADVLGVRYRF